MKRNRFH